MFSPDCVVGVVQTGRLADRKADRKADRQTLDIECSALTVW